MFGNSVLQMCFAGLRRFHQREGVSQTSWLQQDRVAFKMYIIVCATSLPEECFKKKHVTTFLLFAPARPPVRGVCMFLPVRLDWTLKLSELELYVCIRVLVTSCHNVSTSYRESSPHILLPCTPPLWSDVGAWLIAVKPAANSNRSVVRLDSDSLRRMKRLQVRTKRWLRLNLA